MVRYPDIIHDILTKDFNQTSIMSIFNTKFA